MKLLASKVCVGINDVDNCINTNDYNNYVFTTLRRVVSFGFWLYIQFYLFGNPLLDVNIVMVLVPVNCLHIHGISPCVTVHVCIISCLVAR